MSFQEHLSKKVMSVEEAQCTVQRWHLESRKVVFTNGVFDLLHRGHVDYLTDAAELGDELIIGLNSDASTKLLNKGTNRPIQDQDSRARILSSMVFVSAIVIFDEETPKDLIETLKPDILVKGGDYEIHEIAGSEFVLNNGGKVLTIPVTQGFSTTNIEKKIKSS